MDVVEGAGEGDREFKMDSSITIVDAKRSGTEELTEDEVRLRELGRDRDSAARMKSPEELNEALMVDDEETQFSGLAWSTLPGDVFDEVAGAP